MLQLSIKLAVFCPKKVYESLSTFDLEIVHICRMKVNVETLLEKAQIKDYDLKTLVLVKTNYKNR